MIEGRAEVTRQRRRAVGIEIAVTDTGAGTGIREYPVDTDVQFHIVTVLGLKNTGHPFEFGATETAAGTEQRVINAEAGFKLAGSNRLLLEDTLHARVVVQYRCDERIQGNRHVRVANRTGQGYQEQHDLPGHHSHTHIDLIG